MNVLTLITTLCGLIVSTTAIEYFYRIYKWRTSFRTIFQKSKLKGLLYELKPNVKKYYKGEDYDKKILYQTNKYGQRSPDFDLANRDGKRILVIGDSIPFGFGVEEKCTFSRYLEKNLNKLGIKTNVINTGTGTYNIIQDYWYLKHKGKIFNPDLVVLSLNLSNLIISSDWIFDTKKNYVRVRYPEKVKFKSNTKGTFGGKFSLVGKYLDKLYLFRFIIKPFLANKFADQKISKKIGNIDQIKKYVEIYSSKTDKEFKRRLEFISKINDECQHISARLLILICPFTSQLENNFKNVTLPQETIILYCKKNAVNAIDVLNLFQDIRNTNLIGRYYFDEVHLTAKGHEVVAKELTNISQQILRVS